MFEARTFLHKAEVCLRPSVLFGLIHQRDPEQAIKYLQTAANLFAEVGTEEGWTQSGNAHFRVHGIMYVEEDEIETTEGIQSLEKAADAYLHVDDCYPLAIRLLQGVDTYYRRLGWMRELIAIRSKLVDVRMRKVPLFGVEQPEDTTCIRLAIGSLESLTPLLTQDYQLYTRNRHLKTLATLHSQMGNYKVAAKIFDEIAETHSGSEITSVLSEEMVLSSILCHLANTDLVAARQRVETLKRDPSLREDVERLLEAISRGSASDFAQAAGRLRFVFPSNWFVSMVTRALLTIPSVPILEQGFIDEIDTT